LDAASDFSSDADVFRVDRFAGVVSGEGGESRYGRGDCRCYRDYGAGQTRKSYWFVGAADDGLMRSKFAHGSSSLCFARREFLKQRLRGLRFPQFLNFLLMLEGI
jgi:hypothetical protein